MHTEYFVFVHASKDAGGSSHSNHEPRSLWEITALEKPVYALPKEFEAVFFSFRLRWQFGYVHGTQWCVSLQEVSINS
jgi:hypothetical protein